MKHPFALWIVAVLAILSPGCDVLAPRGDRPEVMDQGYALTRLGTLGGAETTPNDLNDLGEVVGSSQTAAGEWHAFHWENDRMTDLGTLRDRSAANAINNDGVIVGSMLTALHDQISKPVRWVKGVMLPLPGGQLGLDGSAVDIDERGRILIFDAARTLLLWDAGDTTRLSSLYWFAVYGMNSAGTVVGSAHINSYVAGVLVRDGEVLRIASSRSDAAIRAINDAGRYVGHQAGMGNGTPPDVQGFIGENGDTAHIGTLPGKTVTRPMALNERGEVVGIATNSLGASRGFHWKAGAMTDLTDALVDREWVVVEASAINERGQIVGRAKNLKTLLTEAVLLSPRGASSGKSSPAVGLHR